MTKPEQELLAKYLLQQLISPDHDPELDPIVARLTRADQCDLTSVNYIELVTDRRCAGVRVTSTMRRC